MPAVDFCQVALEESPLNEQTWDDAATPSRISTVLMYPPARSARIAASPQHLRRNDELRGITGEVKRLIETYEPVGVLTERAYANDMTWLLELAGFDGVVTAGGATVTGGAETTATGVNALNSPIVNVGSTSGFPTTGTWILGGVATTYTGKTPTSFTGCGSHVATTGGEIINDNVPVGANKWVFNKRDAIKAQTARIRTNYASEDVLLEGYGFGVSTLGLTAAGDVNAALMGLFMRRLAADTSTVPAPVASSIPPLRRGDLYVSALAAGGELGDWTLNIANELERIRTLSVDPSSFWPDTLEHGDAQVEVTGSIPKRILDADDVDALLNATSFAMVARWISPVNIGATAKPYQAWVKMPACQLVSGEADELSNRRRHGHSFEWAAAYDETAGYDARITLVNGVTAIQTPF